MWHCEKVTTHDSHSNNALAPLFFQLDYFGDIFIKKIEHILGQSSEYLLYGCLLASSLVKFEYAGLKLLCGDVCEMFDKYYYLKPEKNDNGRV